MHIDYLLEFEDLAKRLNYNEAAKALHMTQSNLSKHMAALQKETGLQLFRKEKNRTVLTPAGGMFLNGISDMLTNYKELIEKCRAVQKLKIASLCLQKPGAVNLAAKRLYRAVADYTHDYPNTRFRFKLISQEGPGGALDSNDVDIAFVLEYPNSKTIEQRHDEKGWISVCVATEPMVAWCKRDNTLNDKEKITLDDLAGHRIMVPVGVFYDYFTDAVEEMFYSEGLQLSKDKRSGVASTSEFFLYNPHDSVYLFTKAYSSDPMLAIRDDMVIKEFDDPRACVSTYFVALKTGAKEEVYSFMDFLKAQNFS